MTRNIADLRRSSDSDMQQRIAELADDLSFALSKIATAEALYRTRFSIDNMTDTVFWADEEGRFIDFHNGACSNLGYAREELPSMGIADIDPYFSRTGWPRHWEEISRKGMMVIESVFHTRCGTAMPVEATHDFYNILGVIMGYAELAEHLLHMFPQLKCLFMSGYTANVPITGCRTRASTSS